MQDDEAQQEDDSGLIDLFASDADDRIPPELPPTTKRFVAADGRKIDIQLVAGHPLWGHVLYPTAIELSRYLEHNPDLISNKTVLELGAAGGLPSIAAALLDARFTVCTDYPDRPLIATIEHNLAQNLPEDVQARTAAAGYVWGTSTNDLLALLPAHSPKFDTLLLSDLVFNHSQQDALLKTCKDVIAPGGIVLNFFAHHRPTSILIERDLAFLEKARKQGWRVERVVENTLAGPAFPEDGGDLAIRSTVHGHALTREI